MLLDTPPLTLRCTGEEELVSGPAHSGPMLPNREEGVKRQVLGRFFLPVRSVGVPWRLRGVSGWKLCEK